MGVRIEDGTFSSAFGLEGHALTRCLRRWASHIVKGDSLDFLIKAIRETRELELWKRNISGRVYGSIDEFFRDQLHLPEDFHYSRIEQLAEEVEKVKKVKPKSISELKQYRNEQIKDMSSNGFTQVEIAEKFGIDRSRVSQIVLEKTRLPKKTNTINKPNRVIKLSENPGRAAEQIINKFGDEFASSLAEKLNNF